MNKITATGRVVADAELRANASGDSVCSFRVASDVGFGDRRTTNWFTCTIWGRRGESLVGYLKKGTPVTVFGTLTLREWTNRDGVKQLSPDIRIDEITMHGRAESAPASHRADSQPAPRNTLTQQGPGSSFDDDDPPF